MSEKLNTGHEQKFHLEDAGKEASERIEALRREALEAASPAEKADVESLEANAKEVAVTSAELTSNDKEPDSNPTHFSEHRAHKAKTYEDTVKRVQSRLTTPERTLSKIAHQPQVESISNAAAKTVSRASGILGAGVCAFVGSFVLLYLSRQYGYVYNYTSFIALVFIGYFGGLCAEILIKSLRRK